MGSSHLAPCLRAPGPRREHPSKGRAKWAEGLRLLEKSRGAAVRSSQPRGGQRQCPLAWDVPKIGASPSFLAGSSYLCSTGVRL